MASVTLSAYEITINKLKSPDFEVLNDYNNGKDFLNYLYSILTKWAYEANITTTIVEDEEDSKRLRIVKSSLSLVGRKIEGIVETGDYGLKLDVANKEGVKTKIIAKNESPMRPFYFAAFFPKDKTSAIIIFQKFKNRGAYGVFEKMLKREFRSDHSSFVLRIAPLVSKQLIDDFLGRGAIKQISFKNRINNKVISSPDDKYSTLEADDYYTEYNIVARKGKFLKIGKRLKKYLLGTDDLMDLVSIRDYQFNEIKTTLKLGNHVRTINLSAMNKLGAFFDITDEVSIDEGTGFPNMKSVSAEGTKILDDILTATELI